MNNVVFVLIAEGLYRKRVVHRRTFFSSSQTKNSHKAKITYRQCRDSASPGDEARASIVREKTANYNPGGRARQDDVDDSNAVSQSTIKLYTNAPSHTGAALACRRYLSGNPFSNTPRV